MDLPMLYVPQICAHGTFGLDLLQTFLEIIGHHDLLRTEVMTDSTAKDLQQSVRAQVVRIAFRFCGPSYLCLITLTAGAYLIGITSTTCCRQRIRIVTLIYRIDSEYIFTCLGLLCMK